MDYEAFGDWMKGLDETIYSMADKIDKILEAVARLESAEKPHRDEKSSEAFQPLSSQREMLLEKCEKLTIDVPKGTKTATLAKMVADKLLELKNNPEPASEPAQEPDIDPLFADSKPLISKKELIQKLQAYHKMVRNTAAVTKLIKEYGKADRSDEIKEENYRALYDAVEREMENDGI
jgi:hypothetical protein